MAFGILVILLFIGAFLYLNDSFKCYKTNKEYYEKTNRIYRHADTKISAVGLTAGYMRDYVGEFEFANKKYQDILKTFKSRYPIGSCYDYTDWDKGPQTMYIETEQDQNKALDLDYKFDKFTQHGAMSYCLWEARKDAVARGFAPDNVKDRIHYDYDAMKNHGHNDLDPRTNRWVEDCQYDCPVIMSAEPNFGSGIYTKVGNAPKILIFPWCDEGNPLYEKEFNRIREVLRKEQDKQNAIARHNGNTRSVVIKKNEKKDRGPYYRHELTGFEIVAIIALIWQIFDLICTLMK